MELFGLSIRHSETGELLVGRTKAATLSPVDSNRGWWPYLRESFAGAWQQNVEVRLQDVSAHSTVFACVTLIASDIAKMRIRLVQQDSNGVWKEIDSPAFTPVLRKPNHYQDRIQFYASWVISKLLYGNSYVLKQRDDRRVVVAHYVLDPSRVKPLVATDGSVFYDLQRDDLSNLPVEQRIVPASEIIHDRHNTFFHPLVGLSAIYACGLAAVQGLNIQNNSTRFFANGSNPGGVLTAPGHIADETAARLKAYWDANFTGEKVGQVAVLGDGLTYEQMSMSAVDSQLIEQLKWSALTVCSTFHVPPYMVGVGPPPTYNNIEALNQQYYSQCLQVLIEAIELSLDEGLGLTTGENASKRYGTEFDIDDLLRMDSSTMMKTIGDGVKAGVYAPNEGRAKLNMAPVEGGESPYLQQQNWPLRMLSERSLPALQPTPSESVPAVPETPDNATDDADERAMANELILKTGALAMTREYESCLS